MLEDIYSEYCCFFSDACGNNLCPYVSGNISYTELSSPENRAQAPQMLAGDRLICETQTAVLIKGYVTVAHETEGYKETVSFNTIATIHLPFIPEGDLTFATKYFSCRLQPAKSNVRSTYLRIFVDIETYVCDDACETGANSTVAFLENSSSQRKCVTFQTGITVLCRRPAMQADVHQYNAIAQEQQRVFTDEDELTEYGSRGIPSPSDISFCKVYVNGLLQPPANYDIQRGGLRLKTEDFPSKGAVVSVYSSRLKNSRNYKYNAFTSYYVAVSDGVKTTYTDKDALTEYGDNGIPSPCEVSFVNLYVNGVLQPAPIYSLEKGFMELVEAPKAGQYIILESVIVR